MRLSLPLSAAAALLALSASAPTATADVRDDAGFFSADAVSKANDVIKEIKREFQKDLVIETFRRAPADKPDATSADPKVKDRFFTEWTLQQAREEQVNGIYVLICKEPPYIKPAVGNRTHAMFSDEDRDRLGQILVDHFKKKDYDDGLLEAVRYVQTSLKAPDKQAERRPAGQSAPPAWPPPGGNRRETGGFSLGGLGGLLCVGLVVLAVIAVIWMAVSALGRALHQGPVGYGPGGYGPAGYGPGGGYMGGGYGAPGGGGGFMSSVLGGLFGGAAGSWAYDRFFGGHSSSAPMQGYGPGPAAAPEPPAADTDYSAGGGGDFGGVPDVGGGGGDFGGGGGGDFGGGGGGGGDFGGGGGGDAGGGGGF